jgi:segregation and condensation protein B
MEKKLAEAALFMSPEPLTLDELTKIMNAASFSVSLKILDDLIGEYEKKDTSLEIVKTDDSRYVMRVKGDFLDNVSHLAVSTEMTKAVLRTLGLIAAKQPVKQSLVVAIIGNKAYNYVGELENNGFVRAKKFGNTKILETTEKFDNYFGKDVEQIKRIAAAQQTLST